MTQISQNFKTHLRAYIAEFIGRVTSGSSDQRPVPTPPEFAKACADANVWFKTSFGHGNLAEIPWLACFFPGQRASLDGVYPVLLYRRDNASLSTAYGVSASAQKVAGDWPRVWPDSVVAGLKKFPVKKYGDSYVSHVFQTFDPSNIDEITAQFVKIIEDFLILRSETTLHAALDNSLFIRFGESLFEANLSFTRGAIERFSVALLSKRFCVLTGLSGSGKTKLAEAFAMWLCESPRQ